MKKLLITVAAIAMLATTATAAVINETKSGEWTATKVWDEATEELVCFANSNFEANGSVVLAGNARGEIGLTFIYSGWQLTKGESEDVVISFQEGNGIFYRSMKASNTRVCGHSS